MAARRPFFLTMAGLSIGESVSLKKKYQCLPNLPGQTMKFQEPPKKPSLSLKKIYRHLKVVCQFCRGSKLIPVFFSASPRLNPFSALCVEVRRSPVQCETSCLNRQGLLRPWISSCQNTFTPRIGIYSPAIQHSLLENLQ